MPYIITTKTPQSRASYEPVRFDIDHAAVATLNKARAVASATIRSLAGNGLTFNEAETAALASLDRIGESGGTVGPLPDGTVIVVRRTDRRELADSLGLTDREQSWMTDATLIAAFNAAI
jgi:hypothetical protein